MVMHIICARQVVTNGLCRVVVVVGGGGGEGEGEGEGCEGGCAASTAPVFCFGARRETETETADRRWYILTSKARSKIHELKRYAWSAHTVCPRRSGKKMVVYSSTGEVWVCASAEPEV